MNRVELILLVALALTVTLVLLYLLLRCTRSRVEIPPENSEKLTSGIVPVYGENVKDYYDEESQRSNPGNALSPLSANVASDGKPPRETELSPKGHYNTDSQVRESTPVSYNSVNLKHQEITERVMETVAADIARIFEIRGESKRPDVNIEEILDRCNDQNTIGDGMTATVYKVPGEIVGFYAVEWIAVKAIDMVGYIECVLRNGWPEALACRQLSLEIAAYELLSTSPHPNLLHTLTVRNSPLTRERKAVVLLSEYRECKSLADLLAEQRFLDESEACNIVLQVAKALYHMHYRLLLAHRDIKLNNIVCYPPKSRSYGSQSNDLHVEIIDFGHCRPLLLQNYLFAVSKISLPPERRMHSAPETKRGDMRSLHCESQRISNTSKNLAAQISGLSVDATLAHVGGTLHYQSPEMLNFCSDRTLERLSKEIEVDLHQGSTSSSQKDEFGVLSSPKQRLHPESGKVAPIDLQACDIWALGVVTYALVAGKLPFFSAENDSDVYRWKNGAAHDHPQKMVQDIIKLRISWCQFTTPVNSLAVSSSCKSFLTQCLNPDPQKRIRIEEIFEHQWITRPT